MSAEKNGASEKPTLTQFIESNHKLISTLAILAALSAFSNSLPGKEWGKILSFLFFTLSILVYLEIEFNFPYTTGGKLYLFQQIFRSALMVFCFAWIQMYYPVLIALLYMVLVLFVLLLIFAFFQMAIRKTVLRMSWLKDANQKTRELVPIFGAMPPTTLVVFVVGRYSATLISFMRRFCHL